MYSLSQFLLTLLKQSFKRVVFHAGAFRRLTNEKILSRNLIRVNKFPRCRENRPLSISSNCSAVGRQSGRSASIKLLNCDVALFFDA
jgi:hypothetical protein